MKRQSRKSLRLDCDLSNRASLQNRPPWQTGSEKENHLNKRKKVAAAAGLDCCGCGGLIFNLSDGRRVCGDCRRQF